jgi:hypothetical protein
VNDDNNAPDEQPDPRYRLLAKFYRRADLARLIGAAVLFLHIEAAALVWLT